MEPLSIPQELVPEYHRLADLPVERLEAVAAALKAAWPVTSRKAMLATVTRSISKEQAEALETAVFSLAPLMVNRGRSGAEVAAALMAGLRSTVAEEIYRKLDLLSPTIGKLLELPAVQFLQKGAQLAFARSVILSSARIMTDIRPVFGAELAGFECAIVTHTLQLNLWRDGRSERLEVAIDSADIRALVDTCKRATEKATACQTKLQQCGVSVLRVAGDGEEDDDDGS